MRALVVSPYIPSEKTGGSGIKISHTLKTLSSLTSDYDFFCFYSNRKELNYLMKLKHIYKGINVFPIYHDFRLSSLNKFRLFKKGIYIRRFFSVSLDKLLKKTQKYDLAYLDSFFSYLYIDAVKSDNIFVDFHNVHSVLLENYIKNEKNIFKRIVYKREKDHLSETENRLLKDSSIKKIITGKLPDRLKKIETNTFYHIPSPMIEPSDVKRIHKNKNVLFTGNFNWIFNKMAIDMFKRLSIRFKDINFTIAGKGLSDSLTDLPNLHFIKDPETTLELFRKNSIFISPVMNPTGINLKIIQAAYCGNLIIAGKDSISKIPGLSDSAITFKDENHLIRLLEDLKFPLRVDNSKAVDHIEENNRKFKLLFKRI